MAAKIEPPLCFTEGDLLKKANTSGKFIGTHLYLFNWFCFDIMFYHDSMAVLTEVAPDVLHTMNFERAGHQNVAIASSSHNREAS